MWTRLRICSHWTVADPGFPMRRGCQPPKFGPKTYYLTSFGLKTAWTWRILDRERGTRPYLPTSLEPLATTRVFFDVFRLPPVSVKVEFAENPFISDFGFAIAITQCERYLRILWSLPQCGVSSHRNTRKTTDEKRSEPESEKLLVNNLHLSHTADTSHESCSDWFGDSD